MIGWSGPVALAAMGGFASERGGVINIALEGKMLSAACAAFVLSVVWQNPVLSLAGAIATAILLSLLHWLLTQKYRLDHIISGMAINAIALGATNYFDTQYAGRVSGELPVIPLPYFWVAAYTLPFLVYLYSRYTRGGLRLSATGDDPDKSRLVGIEPLKVRFFALIATGVFTGIAGTALFSSAGQFTEGMTAGKGFIALAALIVGGWKPIPTVAACLAFGFFQALQLQLQGTKIFGPDIPAEVFSSLPYIVTVIALAGFLGQTRPPSSLGKL